MTDYGRNRRVKRKRVGAEKESQTVPKCLYNREMNTLWLLESTVGKAKLCYNCFVESRPCNTYEAQRHQTSPTLGHLEIWKDRHGWWRVSYPSLVYVALTVDIAGGISNRPDRRPQQAADNRVSLKVLKTGSCALLRPDNPRSLETEGGPVSFLASQLSWLSNDAACYWGQIRTGSQGLTKALLPLPVWGGPIYRLQLHQQPLEEIQLTHCRPTVRDSTWILLYNFRVQRISKESLFVVFFQAG